MVYSIVNVGLSTHCGSTVTIGLNVKSLDVFYGQYIMEVSILRVGLRTREEERGVSIEEEEWAN